MNILICDDDLDMLYICRFILENKGHTVFTSTHCNDIISIVEQAQPHVIIMDNWIPDIGGIVASQTIRAHHTHKNIPIIYFSANKDVELLAQQAGANTFLKKPFNIEDLERIVQEMLLLNGSLINK